MIKFSIEGSYYGKVGDLRSSTFLNREIAFKTLGSFERNDLIPSARKEKIGWIAVLEDSEGRLIFFNSGYSTQEEALQAAKNSFSQL